MSSESDLIARLRAFANHPAARGLNDDAAVMTAPIGRDLVLTHDMLVEGVHYLADDPPGDVAWKLLAVNLSDLAGKGAEPLGVLLGFTLGGDAGWDSAFVDGLGRALNAFNVPLLGGDTVAGQGARVLGLSAIGQVASGGAPARGTAKAGDDLWVSGTIGDAGAGLRIALGTLHAQDDALMKPLLKRYRLPMPRLALGRLLRCNVRAMMDVSDGLLIDAARMAAASGVTARIDLDALPLSPSYRAIAGSDEAARIAAATAGDDYELLFAADPACCDAIEAASREQKIMLSKIGTLAPGHGLNVWYKGKLVQIEGSLGWEH